MSRNEAVLILPAITAGTSMDINEFHQKFKSSKTYQVLEKVNVSISSKDLTRRVKLSKIR